MCVCVCVCVCMCVCVCVCVCVCNTTSRMASLNLWCGITVFQLLSRPHP